MSKNNNFESDQWHKNYIQNYDTTLHEGRSNKTAHLLPSVSRTSNDAIRNSTALTFPDDAKYFFCMLNTKDLTSAGEHNMLADFVIMTENTDKILLFNYLKSCGGTQGDQYLIIDGFLTGLFKNWTLSDLSL